MTHRALFLEFDDWTSRIVRSALKLQGFEIVLCKTEREFLNHLSNFTPGVVVLDVGDGSQAWRQVCLRDLRRRGYKAIPRFVLGKRGLIEALASELAMAREEWIAYPVHFNQLTIRLEELREKIKSASLYAEGIEDGVEIEITVPATLSMLNEASIGLKSPLGECADAGEVAIESDFFRQIGVRAPRACPIGGARLGAEELHFKPLDWREEDLGCIRRWASRNRIRKANG